MPAERQRILEGREQRALAWLGVLFSSHGQQLVSLCSGPSRSAGARRDHNTSCSSWSYGARAHAVMYRVLSDADAEQHSAMASRVRAQFLQGMHDALAGAGGSMPDVQSQGSDRFQQSSR